MAAAARLFAQRGYHAVGINDISGELGLTGPAFYRHYPSKEALLVAVLDEVMTAHLENVVQLVRSIHDPAVALRAIVDNHVEFVLSQTANIQTWRTEFRSLPDADRHRLRYLQRLYTEEWVHTLRQLRPTLSADEARTMCQGAIALIQSATEFHTRLNADLLGRTLSSMAVHVLVDAPVGGVGAPRADLAASV
jgi:AcrR family transcriptional regulator